MLETKSYKFVRNILWPFKSTLEISDAGINNKGTLTRWEDIEEYNFGLQPIQNALQYMYRFKDRSGKKTFINMVVPITAGKTKRNMMWEIYLDMDQGFRVKVIEPAIPALVEKLNNGEQLELAKCKLDLKGITIRKGVIKKTPIFIPWASTQVSRTEDHTGVLIADIGNPKTSMLIQHVTSKESRLVEVLATNMLSSAGGPRK